MIGVRLGNGIDELFGCRTMEQRWSCLTEIYRSLGFDQINYAVLNLTSGSRAEASVTQYSTMDAGWIEHYLSDRLDLHDPHVRFVREMGWQPYFFEAAAMVDRLESRERSVIEQAADAGLRSQISVVFPGATGEQGPSGGITIGSSLAVKDFRAAVNGKEQQLIALSMIFHNLSLPEVRRSQMNLRPLTARERDCLRYTADGLRIGQIAQRLAISNVTIELHLRNARRKLKAATTAQAVAHAILAGELGV